MHRRITEGYRARAAYRIAARRYDWDRDTRPPSGHDAPVRFTGGPAKPSPSPFATAMGLSREAREVRPPPATGFPLVAGLNRFT